MSSLLRYKTILLLKLLVLPIVLADKSGFDYQWDFLHCYRATVEGRFDNDDANDQVRLDARNSSQPKFESHGNSESLCMARKTVYPTDQENLHGNYKTSVDFLNIESDHGINYGHIGIFFNVENDLNFDFLYVRIHNRSNYQFQSGKVINDLMEFGKQLMFYDMIDGSIWHSLEIEVIDDTAMVYFDRSYVGSFQVMSQNFTPIKRAGIFVYNGHENVVMFQDFEVIDLEENHAIRNKLGKYTIEFDYEWDFLHYYKGSLEGTYDIIQPNEQIYLDATHSQAHQNVSSDLCYAYKTNYDIDPNNIFGNYTVSTDFLNSKSIKGINFGHPGIIFNVYDSSNYEFVYVRIHNTSSTRFVQGVVNNDVRNSTNALPYFGPIDGSIWHNLKLVVEDHFADLYLDNSWMGTLSTLFSPITMAGPLLWNGYENAAWFQNLDIEQH